MQWQNYICWLESETGSIHVRNKACFHVFGVGSVRIKTEHNDGNVHITVQNALFAPEMIRNLISSSQSRKCRYKAVNEDSTSTGCGGIFKRINTSTDVVNLIGIESIEELYTAVTHFWPRCLATDRNTNSLESWRARLAHVSLERLKGSSKHVKRLTEAIMTFLILGHPV